jgi:lysophospholipase L1-like esterase
MFAVLTSAALALAPFGLKSGDRVVFYGDSITEQQFYTVDVETFVRTRYPGLNVRFYDRGWSGDSSWGGGGGDPATRVSRDVAPLKPTVVTIMLGMNDGGYVPYEQKIADTFNDWYGKLIGYIQKDAPGARLTLIRTSPWDDIAKDNPPFPKTGWVSWHGYNDVLLHYGKVVQDQAEKNHYSFVDFNKPMTDLVTAAKAANPELATQIIPDGIHPGPAGHIIMAGALLKSWGADPVVSSVHLNAASKAVAGSERTHIDSFDGTSWTQKDEALPFAMDPDDKVVQLVLANSHFTDELNQETLQVEGLAAGNYELSIDGTAVSKFSADQLSTGVNLANFATPMRKQALDVLGAVRERSQLDFFQWRQVRVSHADLPAEAKADQALSALEVQMDDQVIKMAEPKPHKYQLKLVP